MYISHIAKDMKAQEMVILCLKDKISISGDDFDLVL